MSADARLLTIAQRWEIHNIIRAQETSRWIHGEMSTDELEDNHARQFGELIDHLHMRADWKVRGLVKEA